MHAAAGGRKRVRSTRSASTISDSSETTVAGADAATEATVDLTTDTAASTPTGEVAAAADSLHATASSHTAALAASLGAFDDGNGRGKRTKSRRGGAVLDIVKTTDTAATNGHSAAAHNTTDDDRILTAAAAAAATQPASTIDTGAVLRQSSRSLSTTQSTPTTPLASLGHTHQVTHSDPPDPRSVPPTHPHNVGTAVPHHPTFPTSSRGKHYPVLNAAVTPLPNRPTYTELVPSIPTIFYKILAVLSDSEYNLYEHEALALMDKKLFKPTAPPPLSPPPQPQPLHHVYHRHVLMHPTDVPVDELDATKLLLRDHKGGEYVVTACRKEHVRLLYESDASVLGRLGVCPLFLDVYSVQGGKKALVGGAGNERRNRGGGDGWVCTCAEGAVPIVKREEVVATSQPAPTRFPSAGKAGSTVRSEMEGEALTDDAPTDVSVGEHEEEDVSMDDEQHGGKETEADEQVDEESDDAPAVGGVGSGTSGLHETALTDSAAPSSGASPAHPFSSELDMSGVDAIDDDLLLPNDLLTPVNSTPGAHHHTADHPVATPTSSSATTSSYHPPSHINTAFSSSSSFSSLSEADRDKHKRKLSAMQRQLSSVSDQLRSVSAMSNMWEAKYKEEKDVNEKLWARIVKVQRQLRQMSRPLTTALASQGRL